MRSCSGTAKLNLVHLISGTTSRRLETAAVKRENPGSLPTRPELGSATELSTFAGQLGGWQISCASTGAGYRTAPHTFT